MFGGIFRILTGGLLTGLNNRGKNKTERLRVKVTGIIGLVKVSSHAAIGLIAGFVAAVFFLGYPYLEKKDLIEAGLISPQQRLIAAGVLFFVVITARTLNKIFVGRDDRDDRNYEDHG